MRSTVASRWIPCPEHSLSAAHPWRASFNMAPLGISAASALSRLSGVLIAWATSRRSDGSANDVFGGDLPEGDMAQENCFRLLVDQLTNPGTQPEVIADRLQKGMRIEKRTHQACANSSATRALSPSMDPGATNRPFATPGLRGRRWGARLVRRATGRPLRAMTTSPSWPSSIASTRRDSCVFASPLFHSRSSSRTSGSRLAGSASSRSWRRPGRGWLGPTGNTAFQPGTTVRSAGQ